MRLQRNKRRAPSAQIGHLPTDGFSTKQVVTLAIAFMVAVVLLPVGARAAAALLNVVITDPGGTNKAHVDASGNLQVGGTVGITGTPTVGLSSGANTVTIDSSTPVSVSNATEPGRVAFQHFTSFHFLAGTLGVVADVAVPSGKRLVITDVSGSINLPVGQKLINVEVSTIVNGDSGTYDFAPTFTGTLGGGLNDHYSFGRETNFYADGGSDIAIEPERDNTSGNTAIGEISLSGYLIECSTLTCS